jgi:hypothetical protein
MSHLTSFLRVTCGAVCTLALASACGGNSFSRGDDGGSNSGGSVNAGGSVSAGGSSSSAGKPNAGGSAHGGSTAQGGNPAGGSPAGGSGGSTAVGGSGSSGSANYGACNAPTDCAVRGPGCCGLCNGPNIAEKDLIAYNKKYESEVFRQCQLIDIACAPCPMPPGGQGTLSDFVPDCVRGQCVVEDIRQSPVTACMLAKDCRLRRGSGCCESCSGGDVIAVSTNGSFEKLVCGNLQPPCAACFPEPPANVEASCVSGHCQVSDSADL